MPATLANTCRAPCAGEHGAHGVGALERIADVAHHAALGLDEVAPHHRRSFLFQPVRPRLRRSRWPHPTPTPLALRTVSSHEGSYNSCVHGISWCASCRSAR